MLLTVAGYCVPTYPPNRPLPGSGTVGYTFNFAALSQDASAIPSIVGAVVVFRESNSVVFVVVEVVNTWSCFVQLTMSPAKKINAEETQNCLFLRRYIMYDLIKKIKVDKEL